MSSRAAGRHLAPVGAALLLLAGGGGGCAYFNTLHNARAKFAEAQDIKDRADPEREKITNQEEKLYTDAFERAARVVKYWPESKWVDDALILMGEASFEKGDWSTALRKYDEILTFFPESDLVAEALVQKARTLVATRDYAQATVALDRAEAIDRKEWRDDVAYLRGVVDQELGEEEGALASYARVVEKYAGSPWFADAGMRAGGLAEKRGDPELAVSFYERVRADARTPEERYRGGMAKGNALIEMGAWKRAETTFHDIAGRSANPEDQAKALRWKGYAIAEAGELDRAVDVWNDVIERYPRREGAAGAQLEIGRLRERQGDLEGARAAYDLVREQGTGHPAWQEASERMTRIDRVLELRRQIAEGEDPDPERLRFLLAEQYLERLGEVDEALREYASLASDASGTEWGAKALYAQAWVLENRKDEPDSADVLFRRLASRYAGTEADAWARRRFGYPVWKVERIDPPKVVYVRPEGSDSSPVDIEREIVAPRAVPLPEGVSRVRVWARLNVADDGSVAAVKIVKSGGEEFDAAVEEAARASTFLPPAEGGPSITVREYVFPPDDVAPGEDDAEPTPAERDALPPTDAAPSPNSPPGNASAPPDFATTEALADSLRAAADSVRAPLSSPPPSGTDDLQRKLRDRELDPTNPD